jgi:small conductance mechanosensitive channel
MNIFLQSILDFLITWSRVSGLKILLLVIITSIVFRYGGRAIEKLVRKAVMNDNGLSHAEEERRENTLIEIFEGTFKFVLILVVGLMILSEFGVNIAPLIAGAGIIGLAVGFGGQYLIRDVITGLFIILENQYRVGDAVNIAGIGGSVEDITLRVTVLRDLDGTVHHIPHGEVKTVSNMAKGFARVNLNIGVSYNAELEKVISTINQVGKEMSEDEHFKNLIMKAPEFLRVDDFADSSVIVKILGETKPLSQWEVTGELRKRLKIAFDREGIEIPFPQMVVHKTEEINEAKN